MSPIKIVVLFLILAIVGVACVRNLRRQEAYSQPGNSISITFQSRYDSPDLVEQFITAPLENVLSQLSEIKNIQSTSYIKKGSIEIEFLDGADMDEKIKQVKLLIRRTYKNLKSITSFPVVQRSAEDLPPAISFTINTSGSAGDLETFAHLCRARLLQIEGTESVHIDGLRHRSIRLDVDEFLLQSAGLTPDSIVSHLEEKLSSDIIENLPFSEHESGIGRINQIPGTLETLAALKLSFREKIISVGDIAKITIDEDPGTTRYYFSGQGAIRIDVYATPGVNPATLATAAINVLQDFKSNLKKSATYSISHDSTNEPLSASRIVKITFGFVAVSLLLLLLMVERQLIVVYVATLVTTVSTTLLCFVCFNLPMNVPAGFGILISLISLSYQLSYSFSHSPDNKLSLPLTIQMCRVAAIVVGAAGAVIGIGINQDLSPSVRSFFTGIAVGSFCSLVVFAFFTWSFLRMLQQNVHIEERPVFGYAFALRLIRSFSSTNLFKRAAFFRKGLVVVVILSFGVPVSRILQSKYRGTYGDLIFGGVISRFLDKQEHIYSAPLAHERLSIRASLPFGSKLATTENIVLQLSRMIGRCNGIANVESKIWNKREAFIEAELTDNPDKKKIGKALRDRVIKQAMEWGGVKWSIVGFGQPYTNDTQLLLPKFRFDISGFDYDRLREMSKSIGNKLSAIDRIFGVETDSRVDWTVDEQFEPIISYKEDTLAQLDLSSSEIASALLKIKPERQLKNPFFLSGERLDVVVSVGGQQKLSDLADQKILASGTPYLFSDLCEVKQEQVIRPISKFNRRYFIRISFDYNGPYRSGRSFTRRFLTSLLADLPAGYSASEAQIRFYSDDDGDSFFGIFAVFSLLIMIFSIIVLESWRHVLRLSILLMSALIVPLILFTYLEVKFDLMSLVTSSLITIVVLLNFINSRSDLSETTAAAMLLAATRLSLSFLVAAAIFIFADKQVLASFVFPASLGILISSIGVTLELLTRANITKPYLANADRPQHEPPEETGT